MMPQVEIYSSCYTWYWNWIPVCTPHTCAVMSVCGMLHVTAVVHALQDCSTDGTFDLLRSVGCNLCDHITWLYTEYSEFPLICHHLCGTFQVWCIVLIIDMYTNEILHWNNCKYNGGLIDICCIWYTCMCGWFVCVCVCVCVYTSACDCVYMCVWVDVKWIRIIMTIHTRPAEFAQNPSGAVEEEYRKPRGAGLHPSSSPDCWCGVGTHCWGQYCTIPPLCDLCTCVCMCMYKYLYMFCWFRIPLKS